MKKKGVKEFAQTASLAYKSMSAAQKEELTKKCSDKAKPLTAKDIKREGCKIFKNMDKQVPVPHKISVWCPTISTGLWDLKIPLL